MTHLLTLCAGLLALLAGSPSRADQVPAPWADNPGLNASYVFTYETGQQVKGNGHDLQIAMGADDHHLFYRGNWDRDQGNDLRHGPAQARLDFRRGQLVDVEIRVAARRAMSADHDLGTLPAATAARYLLDLATRPMLDEDPASGALLGAVIARDAPVARPLIAIMEDGDLSREVRQDALFWVAALAAEKALAPIRHLLGDPDEDMEMREHAVFALAQMERQDTLDTLLSIAHDQKEPRLQRAAFFALAEYDEPRVHALFRQVLLDE